MTDHSARDRENGRLSAIAVNRAADVLELVKEYVARETPTGDAGRINELATLIADDHTTLGGRVRRIFSAGGDHLVIDHPGRGALAGSAPVLLLGHYDTVHAAGALDGEMPMIERDGRFSGPGAYDMKSGLAIIRAAVAGLAEYAREFPAAAHRPIRIVMNSDEEVGSPTSRGVVEAEAHDAVAALGFESPHPDGAVKVGRWGSTRVRLEVGGREAHAALDPEKGVSAIDELLDQLMIVRGLAERFSGSVLCNVGTLRGGGKTNVVPARASADIGLRFRDADDEKVVMAGLTALRPIRQGATVACEVLSSRPTWSPSAADRELAESVRAADGGFGRSTGALPASGAADTNFTGSLGIPSVDGLGPRGRGAHAVHEEIVVDGLRERLELVMALLHRL